MLNCADCNKQHVDMFMYKMEHQKQNLSKHAKIDFLQLTSAKWTWVGQFTDILSYANVMYIILDGWAEGNNTSAEHAGSMSQMQSTGTAATSEPAVSGDMTQTNSNGQNTSQQVLATACITIIEDYRCSCTSKIKANVALIETISAELFATPELHVSTIAKPYLYMLNEVESEHAHSGDNLTREPRMCVNEPAHDDKEAPIPKDRSRAGSVESGEPAHKQSKLNYSSIEVAVKTRCYQPLSPSLEYTNEILKKWSQDQKESRWAEIITGECINLNVVHTIITSSQTVDKQTKTLRGVEIKYGVSEAVSRKITTDSKWDAAWNKSADAIKFTFPH
ncbi:uncharacterized protein BJ212DRAFT_1488877 [Suillus subaureus]|uniref:Uncharacterized protein n=1 Tax=Suillus subaureus TaxID=48587 RepID=A0A9P7DL95_9AGAM|nr:uncharacterized protein BJ212DRAFT_1488877 [Suillus subaureus]KAG1797649.1 hypothetical protein BJ212DRAFT_1488877 [Suillus subaureus]